MLYKFNSKAGFIVKIAIIGLMFCITACQQEPCTGGTIPWFGIQVYVNDSLRTNALSNLVGIGASNAASIFIGTQKQYLVQLNPASDFCSYQLTMADRPNLPVVTIRYQKVPYLISERCGFGFQYNQITTNVIGVDSFALVKPLADSTKGTNLIIWIK